MLKFLKAAALATVPVVGIFVCVLLHEVTDGVQEVREQAILLTTDTLTQERAISEAAIDTLRTADNSVEDISFVASHTLSSANDVLRTINRPCGKSKACGTLADVGKTLNTVRGTFGQVEVAANSFDKHQTTFYTQESDVASMTLDTLMRVDSMIGSPELNEALRNFDASSKSVADGTAQAAAILADARVEADKLAHPPKKKLTFWGALVAGGDAARHFMPPIF